ncbi:MAG: hypothetical protein ABI999_01075 [Acidobacteriota bacterium]
MLKTLSLFAFLFSLSVNSAFAQAGTAIAVAVQKSTLPEFRDASVWKGRKGLTLFSPDAKYVAVSGKTVDVVIYDTASGVIKSKIDGTGFSAFSFSPDSKYVVAQNTADMSIEIYDTETGTKIREIRGLGNLSKITKSFGSGLINEANGVYPTAYLEMTGVPVSPDWKSVLVNKNDKEFSVFDLRTGNLRFDLEHADNNAGWETTKTVFAILGGLAGSPAGFMLLGSVSNTQFSTDSSRLVITNGNKFPTLWDTATGRLVAKLDSGQRVYYSAFSPDSKMVATSDYFGMSKIWSAETGAQIVSFGSKKDRGVVVGWSKDSTKIFVDPIRKGDLEAVDPRTGNALYTFGHSNPGAMLLSNDKSTLATIPRKNKTVLFQLWDVETGKMLGSVPRAKGHDTLSSFKWSPDDKYIVTIANIKEAVEIWSRNGEHLQTLQNSTFPVRFSDDGRLLATGGKLANSSADIGYIWEIK